MKQKTTLILIAFLVTFTLNAQTVQIGATSYNTISEAIVAANSGDIIQITGAHTESITIDKSITLRGADPTTDIIQAAASPNNDGSGNRVITMDSGDFTIAIENLGIKNGNSADNGGGVFVDKVTGSVVLTNLIIENNYAAKNGGAIGFAGSIATVTNCTIQNNTSSLDGGAILAAPNNASGINSVIDIKQSLIDSNTGRNGGGVYINGNNNFGNDFLIDVNIENSTVSNNNATSASGGNGGGAIFSASRPWTNDTSIGNISLKLVHATFYGNTHAALGKSGIQFGSAKVTNFSAFNSIIVSTDDLNTKALNFTNTNTTDVINCILGGLTSVPTAIVDDVNKNNLKGKTATFAGLSGTLSDEGGSTQVLAIADASNSVDYCTADTGLTLPSIDQRGATRSGTPDAGAFEFGGTLSINNFDFANKITMYPNPARTNVIINGVENIETIEVYSILGKLLKKVENQNTINVENLAKGIYLINIKKDSNTISKRFIIE